MPSNQSTGMPPASKRSSSPALGGPMPTLIEENKSLVQVPVVVSGTVRVNAKRIAPQVAADARAALLNALSFEALAFGPPDPWDFTGLKPSRLSMAFNIFASSLMLSSALTIFSSLSAGMVSATNTVMNGTGWVFPITFKLPGLTLPQPSSNGSA